MAENNSTECPGGGKSGGEVVDFRAHWQRQLERDWGADVIAELVDRMSQPFDEFDDYRRQAEARLHLAMAKIRRVLGGHPEHVEAVEAILEEELLSA